MSITTPEENNDAVDIKPFCCKFCGSENYIRYGIKNGKQEYQCKDCNRRFVDNLYFENLKANPKIICLTLDLYFKGFSLRKIVDHLKQFYNLKVSHTTLLRWIENYIAIMDAYVSQFKPNLGNIWQVDEMMVQIDGDWFYLWNILDTRSRFHLASVISKQRRVMDARKVFQQAKKIVMDRDLSLLLLMVFIPMVRRLIKSFILAELKPSISVMLGLTGEKINIYYGIIIKLKDFMEQSGSVIKLNVV